MTALLTMLIGVMTMASAEDVMLRVSVSEGEIGMGRAVTVTAEATLAAGEPAVGRLLLPYVDGARWGSHEIADENGRATFHMPLPNAGLREIQVGVGAAGMAAEEWIWAEELADHQTIYAQGVFELEAPLDDAGLWLAVDDSAEAWINGHSLGAFGGWMVDVPVPVSKELLREGRNTLSVAARNGEGPAGLLARLERGAGQLLSYTGDGWRLFANPPAGWPGETGDEGTPPHVIGSAHRALWAGSMSQWPSLQWRKHLITGTRMPEEMSATASAPVTVRVFRRELQAPPRDPDHLVGMQWEPWFSPSNANWSTAQAVPVMGFFHSWDRDVTRQHMIWMVESGVDFLVVDWTNHLWGKEHWNERGPHANEILHATQMALDVLAEMRDEGIPVPRVVLYPGLNNGPATTTTAVNEELDWIYHTYVRNPRFAGLFLEYLEKPLVIIHNGGGPKALDGQEPIDEEQFTVRWHSSQHDTNHLNEEGYWSWMDGSLEPMLTTYEGEPEALTVSVAFFDGRGWTGPGAFGRRNGWTYVESFRSALRHRPKFIEIHQFNEFAGQMEGQGYGPDGDLYGDSYSVELSDDIEPVSLSAPGYRGDGGWGYLYLNLTRALVDLYRQETPETTVVAIGAPLGRAVVDSDALAVHWTYVGATPESFSVLVNGRIVADGLGGTETTVDLTDVPSGPVRLKVIAEGTKCRYEPLYTEDALPLAEPVEAYAEIEFTIDR